MRTEFGPGTTSSDATGTSDVHILHAESGKVVLPSSEIMLESMYARVGADLVITSPEHGKYVVKGFFLSDQPPMLTDGAHTHIRGDVAAQFAGPISVDHYAGQTAAAGASIGQVRSLTGVVEVDRNGTIVTLKVGDPVYQNDEITTKAGAKLGLILVDGTVLALGEKGELVLDELVYDPFTKGGNAALRLVSGAAEFVSGSIAKSGQDHMTFKTPVGTIGIRGTKVFAQYDPVTGEITILNRPTGTGANGQVLAGEIVLTLPNGQVIGNMTAGDGGWQWNAAQGQQPQTVQFTPAQVQGIVAGVAGVVNNLQQIQTQQQQQQQNGTQPAGGQNGGGDNNGGNGNGGNGQGNQGSTTTGDAGTTTTTTVNNVTVTTTTTGQGTTVSNFNIGAAVVVTNNVTTATTGTTGTNTTGTTGTGTTGTPTVQPPPPPPPPPPAQVAVSGGGTVSDHTATSVTFTITRTVNTTSTFSVNYTIGGGTATPGTDYTGGSGTLTFAANELSKTITVPIAANGRSEGDETFSLTLSNATGGTIIAGNTAPVTITADDPLPTVSIGNVTVSDKVDGTATLTITRTGALYGPATVTYKTVGTGSAQAGSDYTETTGTVTFAANQQTATITIPIIGDKGPLTSANREGDETFTVVLTDPTDATISTTGGTGTVTITADPQLASFSVSGGSGSEAAGTATFTITRVGNPTGTVTVDYSLGSNTAFSGSDFSGSGGTVTFGPNEFSKIVTVPIVSDTTVEPEENFTVTLSNPNGGEITTGTATVTINADPVPVPQAAAPTILGAYSDNAYAQVPGAASQIVSGSIVAVSSHTVEAWIRPATDLGDGYGGNPQTIAAFPGGSSMYFMYQADHHISVQLGDGSGTKKIVSSVTVSPDQWHHVAYTYNQTTGDLRLYIDGVEDTAVTHPNNDTLNFTSSSSFFAGGGATPFQGGIDEVRLWDNVRTGTEIHDNADVTLPSTTTHLQIQYSFDNFNGSIVTNTGIGGATLNGSTSNTFRGPYDSDKTLVFDGATHITTNITPLTPSFSLQASIRLLANTGGERPIFAKPTVVGGADETFEFQLFINSSNQLVLRMGQGTGNGYTDFVGKTLLAGVSYDVAATYNPQTMQVGVYVNGQLFVNGAASFGSFMGGMRQFGNQPVDIGHIYDNSGDTYFSGAMTNVRIWDVALSQTIVQNSNMQGVPLSAGGLIADYTFADGSGSAVRDFSGNGHTGTINGTPTYLFDAAPQLQTIGTGEHIDEDTGGSVQLVGIPGTPGATLTYSVDTAPAHGTLTVTSSGFVTYKPAANYNGNDTFIIRLTDSAGGTTTQTVNFTIDPINDRPQIALQVTLPSVTINDTNPPGYTIDDKFGASFVDPDGTFVGVVILANTANPSTQGAWQISTDNSHWYAVPTTSSPTSQYFLSKGTYIRFVPVAGYSGNPGGLVIRAVDQIYVTNGGTFTAANATLTPVSIADANTAMIPFLLSEKNSFVLVTVGAAAAPATAGWDAGGGDGNWNTATNWDGNIAPGVGTAVTIGGSASVLLSGGTTTNIASLTLTGTANLTIDLPMVPPTILALTGNATIGAGTQLTVTDFGVLSSTGGSLNNSGTIYVPDGGAGTLDFKGGAITNLTTDSVMRTQGDLVVEGPLTNNGIGTGHGILIQATDTHDAGLSVTNGNVTNNGDITLSSVVNGSGSAATSATLQVIGGSITNNGSITVSAGPHPGARYLTGAFTNTATGSVTINADTTLTGSLESTGSFTIGGGAKLTLGSNTDFTLPSAWTYAGTGISALHVRGGDGTSNMEANLNFSADASIGANMKLIVGDAHDTTFNIDPEGFVNDTSVMQNAVLTVTGGGTVELRNGAVDMDVVIQSGSAVTATGTNGSTSIARNTNVTGGTLHVLNAADFATADVTVSSTGTVFVEDSDSNGLGTSARFAGSIINNGNVELANSGNGIDTVTAVIEGSFTIANGGAFHVSSYNVLLDNDSALLAKDPGGNLVISNNSVIDVEAGELRLNLAAGVTSYSLVTGATFEIGNVSNNVAHLAGVQTNSSAINLNVSGNLELVKADVTTVINVMSGGLLDVNGTATFHAGVTNSGGTMNVTANSIVDFNPSGSEQFVNHVGGTATFAAGSVITTHGHNPANLGIMTLSGTIYSGDGVDQGGDGFANDTDGVGMNNYGTLIMDGVLELEGGGISNTSTGSITFVAGPGGHKIEAQIFNEHTITVSASTTFDSGSHPFNNLSGGSFQVDSGVTATFHSTNAFLNQSGASITVDGTMTMNGMDIVNSGSLQLNGVINMGDGLTNGNDGGDFTQSGTVSGSGTINMEGGALSGGSTGSLVINPGNSPGHLTINGSLAFNDNSKLNIELAGTQRAQYDILTVNGNYALNGTLNVISYAGFQAAAGDHFDVVTWTTHSGIFQEVNGLDAMHGVGIDTTFTDQGLTLVARATTLEGTDGADVLIGTDQDDVIVGHGGGDVLDGGLGNDLLIGGNGDDVLKGGAGDNHLIGGQGTDTADYSASTAAVHVDLYNGTASNGLGGTDTLISIEKIIGTAHDDIIAGSAKGEIIIGGAGNDIIAGNGGADVLTGGAGNDTFVLHSPHEAGATITDFTTGQDVIELNAAAFGFAPNTDVNACFSVIAGHFDGSSAGINAAFTAGHAALIYSQADHVLYCDTNGPGEGYTTVVTLQSGAQVAATDIHLVSSHAA